MKRSSFALLAGVVAGLLLALPTLAQEGAGAQGIVHLLDYIGVDYAGAVAGGKVKSADEYKEMTEFSGQAVARIKVLPANPARPSLEADAAKLASLVAGKATADAVAESAAGLRWALIRAYGLRVAPRSAPDPARGAALFAENCAACHGAQGRGDGPAAKGLDPVPADFHDAARMAERSVYGLYNAVTLGVPGTSMTPFAKLGEQDRWALALHVAGLGATPERLREGEAAWRSGRLRSAFPDLASLTAYSENEIRRRAGDAAANTLAYLRAHPEALAAGKPAPVAFARGKLAESLVLYRNGNLPAARDAATSAYLEGFELVENSLDNVDKPLRLEIEREMLALRTAIAGGAAPAAIETAVEKADALLASAQGRLDSGELSPGAAFASSLIILLREGLEAILLLAAIIAFIARTGRRDALPYVHTGWIAALLLGLATWAVANFLVGISGANREMTEGVTALIASAMLLYVGYWLHGKSQAQAWTAFIRNSVGQALGKGTLWAMAGVSFVAVYREVFEVVLFYEALWVQAGDAGHPAVLAGVGAAALLLAATGWGIFKYSLKLPLGPFFSAMSLLMALLAIVFAGQGTAALQEAGAISVSPVPFFTLRLLGIHPTLETLGAQTLAAMLVALGMFAASHSAHPAQIKS
jgi:high-affinity iron transporter